MYWKTTLDPQVTTKRIARPEPDQAEPPQATCFEAIVTVLPISLIMWAIIIIALHKLLSIL